MIKTKKTIYDPKEREDGIRILVMRLWPRGISKQKIDRWMRELGSDVSLIKKWKNEEISWQNFEKEYRKNLKGKEALIDELRALSKKEDITLLCSCKDEKHCHRTILKKIIELPST